MALTPLDPSRCIELIGDGAVLIDLRDSAAFGEGHPPRAINVRYDDRHLGERVALIVGGVPRVLLLAVEPAQLENAANQLAAATFDVVGVASDSSAEWADSGSPWVALPSIVTGDLADGPEPLDHVMENRDAVLDVQILHRFSIQPRAVISAREGGNEGSHDSACGSGKSPSSGIGEYWRMRLLAERPRILSKLGGASAGGSLIRLKATSSSRIISPGSMSLITIRYFRWSLL